MLSDNELAKLFIDQQTDTLIDMVGTYISDTGNTPITLISLEQLEFNDEFQDQVEKIIKEPQKVKEYFIKKLLIDAVNNRMIFDKESD